MTVEVTLTSAGIVAWEDCLSDDCHWQRSNAGEWQYRPGHHRHWVSVSYYDVPEMIRDAIENFTTGVSPSNKAPQVYGGWPTRRSPAVRVR
jgi:hypothetical protein